MIFSVLMLALAVAMGTVFCWDVRGIATTMRERLETESIARAWYRRLPPWTFRAFGVWCFVFGVAQLIYVIVAT